MKSKFKAIPGSVVAPKGFLASGVFCDIKRLGRRTLRHKLHNYDPEDC